MTTVQHNLRILEGKGLFLYHRYVGRMLRWQVHGRANISAAHASGKPILWITWHEQVSSSLMYADRFIGGKHFALIRVGDERGDILNQIFSNMGMSSHAVDMGGNPVAAGRSVLRVIQAMKAGKQTMLAPDGPDGPAFEPKDGVTFIAKKSGAAIIPVGTAAKIMLRLPRWDQYQIPLPFTTMHVNFAPPLFAEKGEDDEALRNRISEALSQTRYKAQELAGIAQWP